jgi:hypothetical protein
MRYLFGIACLVLGSMAMSSASPVAATSIVQASSQQPTVPGPSNPYCGKKPADFAMPDVVCPDDGYYTVDAACVAACDETYKAKMVEIYNSACTKYDNANEAYKLCFRLAIHAYDACAAAATTLPELEACRNTMISSVTDCITTLNSTRAGIAANVDVDTTAAKSAFQACASACCKKSGHLDGPSNGGKIGRQEIHND